MLNICCCAFKYFVAGHARPEKRVPLLKESQNQSKRDGSCTIVPLSWELYASRRIYHTYVSGCM